LKQFLKSNIYLCGIYCQLSHFLSWTMCCRSYFSSPFSQCRWS